MSSKAFFNVDPGLDLTPRQLDSFEGGPRTMLGGKIAPFAVASEAEDTLLPPENMNYHRHLLLRGVPYSSRSDHEEGRPITKSDFVQEIRNFAR